MILVVPSNKLCPHPEQKNIRKPFFLTDLQFRPPHNFVLNFQSLDQENPHMDISLLSLSLSSLSCKEQQEKAFDWTKQEEIFYFFWSAALDSSGVWYAGGLFSARYDFLPVFCNTERKNGVILTWKVESLVEIKFDPGFWVIGEYFNQID